MTDSNLVRFLGKQIGNSKEVGLLPYECVEQGPDAIRESLKQLIQNKRRFAIVDALTDRHLISIADACAGLELITGDSRFG